jgi:hypothetical protein
MPKTDSAVPSIQSADWHHPAGLMRFARLVPEAHRIRGIIHETDRQAHGTEGIPIRGYSRLGSIAYFPPVEP